MIINDKASRRFLQITLRSGGIPDITGAFFFETHAPACLARMMIGVKKMKIFFKTFAADESGASAAEYALILAVVGVAIGAGALALGTNVGASITNASNNVQNCGTKAAGATTVGATTFVSPTAC